MGEGKRIMSDILRLAKQATPENWERICSLLSTETQQQLIDGLDQCEKSLDHWPDELRVCPENWFEQLLSGVAFSSLQLVRCLSRKQTRKLLNDRNIQKLLQSQHLANLTILDFAFRFGGEEISDDAFTSADMAVLSDREDLKFHTIKLSRFIDTESVARLLRSPAVSNCRNIDLNWAKVFPDQIVEAVIDSEYLPPISHLNLCWASDGKVGYPQSLSDGGLKRLMESDASRELKSFIYRGFGITAEGIKTLADSPNARSICELELGLSRVGVKPVQYLAESKHLGNQTSFRYIDAHAGDDALRFIAESAKLAEKLEKLYLDSNCFSKKLSESCVLLMSTCIA